MQERWTTTDELLALNVEMTANVARLCVALLNAWSERKNPIPEPLHIRRPGEQTPTVTMGEMARRMLGKG